MKPFKVYDSQRGILIEKITVNGLTYLAPAAGTPAFLAVEACNAADQAYRDAAALAGFRDAEVRALGNRAREARALVERLLNGHDQ